MTVEKSVHKGKRNISVKSAIGIFLLFVAAKTALVPYEDPRYTIAAVNALGGGMAQCESKETPRNKEYPYDAIMVLGGGSIKTDNNTYKLSEETETRLLAGAIALLSGMSDKIFIIYGKSSLAEQTEVIKYLKDKYNQLSDNKKTLPDNTIYFEGESITTASNIDAIVKIKKELDLKRILLLLTDIHGPRGSLLLCDRTTASTLIAEDVISDFNPGTTKLMHAIITSKSMTDAEKREKLLIALSIFDRNALLINEVRKKFDDNPPWR